MTADVRLPELRETTLWLLSVTQSVATCDSSHRNEPTDPSLLLVSGL